MKVFTVMLVFLSFASTGQPTEIATVDFRSIEPALRDLVLSQPKNAELKQRLEAHAKPDVPPETEMDEQGNIVFKTDIKKAMAEAAAFGVREELREKMRRELLFIISDLELQFDVIIDSSYRTAIIFSAVDPRDITQRIYQEVISRLSNSKENTTDDLHEE